MHLMYVRDINQINADDSRLISVDAKNMKNGCLPAGNGNLRDRPYNLLPISRSLLQARELPLQRSIRRPLREISLNSNNAGAFALRVENNTLNFHLRANQQYGVITYLDNSGDSMYHAFQFTLRRRFDAGLGLSVAYTFGKSMDNESTDPVGASSGGGLSTTTSRAPVDAFNLRDSGPGPTLTVAIRSRRLQFMNFRSEREGGCIALARDGSIRSSAARRSTRFRRL
jgi:hypothetical protein